MNDKNDNNSLDVVGFGKIAKAIPPQVYNKSATTLLTTFEKLTAPITEATAGFGRYLRQKFDNMVEAEKAIATYTLEKAVSKAKLKSEKVGKILHPPLHPKSFVKAIEEASNETDPLLHEMWTNLLASQLIEDQKSHPHFVEILPHFSPAEAHILISLVPKSEVGENSGGYLYFDYDRFDYWIKKNGDSDLNKWTLSCVLLCEFQLADILAPKEKQPKKIITILYRTLSGKAFLDAVTP